MSPHSPVLPICYILPIYLLFSPYLSSFFLSFTFYLFFLVLLFIHSPSNSLEWNPPPPGGCIFQYMRPLISFKSDSHRNSVFLVNLENVSLLSHAGINQTDTSSPFSKKDYHHSSLLKDRLSPVFFLLTARLSSCLNVLVLTLRDPVSWIRNYFLF